MINENPFGNCWEIFFKSAEEKRLKKLYSLVEGFWREDFLDMPFCSSPQEFAVASREDKLTLMYQGFEKGVKRLIDVLDLPTLDKDCFEKMTGNELENFLRMLLNDYRYSPFFPSADVESLKKQVTSIDRLEEPARTALKQKVYMEVVNRCTAVTNYSVFADFPKEAIKNKSAHCLTRSALLSVIGKKAGINCEIAFVVDHFVSVAITADGKILMFNSSDPENIGLLVEGESIEGLPNYYRLDPNKRENENIPYHIFIKGSPEVVIGAILNNIIYHLNNFTEGLIRSSNKDGDVSLKKLLRKKYGRNFKQKLREIYNCLCPNNKNTYNSKIWLDEIIRVRYNSDQNWEAVNKAREEKAQREQEKQHQDFIIYRNWVVNNLVRCLAGARGGKAYHITYLFCSNSALIEQLCEEINSPSRRVDTYLTLVDTSAFLVELTEKK